MCHSSAQLHPIHPVARPVSTQCPPIAHYSARLVSQTGRPAPTHVHTRACALLFEVQGQPQRLLQRCRLLWIVMATPLFRPLKRLHVKATRLTAYGMEVQGPLPDRILDENAASKQQVYLVTCPHPKQERAADGTPPRPPSSYDHQFLLDALLDTATYMGAL